MQILIDSIGHTQQIEMATMSSPILDAALRAKLTNESSRAGLSREQACTSISTGSFFFGKKVRSSYNLTVAYNSNWV